MKKITFILVLMITSLVFAQPTTSPTVPTRLQGNVVSVYSGSYTNIATDYNPNFFQSGTVNTAYNPGTGNVCLAYLNFNFQGTILTPTDLSAMEFLHVDVWINKPSSFILNVTTIESSNSGVREHSVTINHAQGSWVGVDIPKSSFRLMDWRSVRELKFDSGTGAAGDIYLDNIYFWKNSTLGTSKFETSSVKMYPNPVKNTLEIEAKGSIDRVSVYNVLGQEVLKASPKSNSVTLQTSDLQKGLYMVTTEIEGQLTTSKVVKE